MLTLKKDTENTADNLTEGQKILRLVYRVLPYWPLVVASILLGLLAAHIYIRYQVPRYSVDAKLLINDDEQQKANLNELVSLDTRDISEETEREIQVLTSRDLIGRLVSKLQLNVEYSQIGFVKTSQFFTNIPFTAELYNPDSI
jgi:uncharacterized protein involved in exopolysaccharide biosynthesis